MAGRKPPEVIYGRYIPAEAAHKPLRDSIRQRAFKFGLVVAGALSLSSSAPEPEPYFDQDLTSVESADRTRAEERAMEAAHPDLNIITFEYVHNSTPQPDRFESRANGHGLNPYYRIDERDDIYQTILAGFNETGTFNPETKQKAALDRYLPEENPENLETTNERVAHHMSEKIRSDMVGDTLGVARLVRLDRDGVQGASSACVVIITSENRDSDGFTQRFAGVDNVVSNRVHDVADFNQLIANHEYAHCVFSQNGQDTWRNESRADFYAVARHIQINGDDGFADTWVDLRNMSIINNRDFGHDTVPLLRRALPVLKEMQANGELDGLDPRELYNKALLGVARAEGHTVAELWESLDEEILARQEAMQDMQGATVKIGAAMRLDQEAANGKNLSRLERRAAEGMVNEYNQALTRQFDLRCMVATRVGGVENVVFERFRDNLDGFVASQDTQMDAYENMRFREWQILTRERHLRHRLGADAAAYIQDNDRDETGLTSNEKLEIYREYSAELAEDLGLTPEQQLTGPERSVS